MKIKIGLFFLILISILFFLGQNLNPLSDKMFAGHDITQAARIQEFTLNIKNGQIPPRMAPDFSNKMGIPVFNFYAPTSYWITSLINISDFNVINSIKISFLLAIIIAFLGSFLFLKNFFGYYPSLLGGVFYITTLYFPIDIFVRGNIGETWFLALFPLSLFFIYKNSQKINHKILFFTIILLSLTLTVHNVLSLIFVPVCLIYILVIKKNLKLNFLTLSVAFLISSSFLIPAILELNLTHAKTIASSTNYNQHFLCINQLWQSPWGYGGSIDGCQDGMSFKIGKIQIIFGILGLLLFLIKFKKYKKGIIPIFLISISLISISLTTYQSKFVWDILKPIFSLFQFPWRFISFSLIGIVFFASYFWQNIKFPIKNIILMILLFLTLFINSKYFYKPGLSYNQFEKLYLSSNYIEKEAAYQIPEYLPKTVSYNYWRSLKNKQLNFDFPLESINNNYKIIINTPWNKEFIINQTDVIKLNIHYFPYWTIKVNNKKFTPIIFDKLGRPIIYTNNRTIIKLSYNQTKIEVFANLISLFTLISILILLFSKKLWNKTKKYLV